MPKKMPSDNLYYFRRNTIPIWCNTIYEKKRKDCIYFNSSTILPISCPKFPHYINYFNFTTYKITKITWAPPDRGKGWPCSPGRT